MTWVDSNGLKLNLKKTNYIVFSRGRIHTVRDIYIGNTLIKRVHEAKFLGVIMDDRLNWAQHIKAVKAKMSRYVGVMYRVKSLLPAKSRIQIFHSFVQSYINYCSLVWGFAARSNIELLFAGQKKGLRAAMPGHVNYFYKDGVIPSHTKQSFNDSNILTVHNVIATNALTFIHKVHNFPESLPPSVRATIATDAPKQGSSHDDCKDWLEKYSNWPLNKTFFYKGPLIYSDEKYSHMITIATLLSFKSYRQKVKTFLLQAQTAGTAEEWHSSNFALFEIAGLRRSRR